MPRIPLLPLLALALLATLGSCGSSAAEEIPPLTFGEPPALRHVMFEIDELNRTIEPILRVPERTPVVASTARSMVRWAEDPAWAAYFDEPEFLGDRPLFEAYRGWLLAGALQLAAAAESGDIDGMRAGFVRAQQSCVACHKRFQPNI